MLNKIQQLDPIFAARLVRQPPKAGQEIGCLNWSGPRFKRSGSKQPTYGKLTRRLPELQSLLAHRYAFFLIHGRWPEDKLLHRCDNMICCEFTHLFEGTHQDNVDDMVNKGRQVQGKRSPLCRYPASLVRAIARAKGTHREVAAQFNVPFRYAKLARQGKARRHLDQE